MVEYGPTKIVNQERKSNPPIVVFGISFGDVSYLDYPPDTKLKVPQDDLLIFFRQMAVMLKSGVSLSQALELLAENMNNKQFGANILDISKRIGSGEELSSSLGRYPRIFSPIMLGLIEAGEAGGILSKVLERLALLIEAQSKIKGQITGALIYPVAILVLAISVSLGLLIFIVPQFETMFSGMGAELPGLTKFMLSLSRLVTSWTFAVAAPLIIFIGFYLFNKLEKEKGLEECFFAREVYNDVSAIRNYLDIDDFRELNLFTYSSKKDYISIDDVSDESGWLKIREDLIRNIGTNSMPRIFVSDISNNGELIVQHEHDGRDLDLEYAEEVVNQINYLWPKGVKFFTIIEEEPFEI